jgi:hypothetical protein
VEWEVHLPPNRQRIVVVEAAPPSALLQLSLGLLRVCLRLLVMGLHTAAGMLAAWAAAWTLVIRVLAKLGCILPPAACGGEAGYGRGETVNVRVSRSDGEEMRVSAVAGTLEGIDWCCAASC